MFLPLRVNFFYEREPRLNYAWMALLIAAQAADSIWNNSASPDRGNPPGILTALFVHSSWLATFLNLLMFWVFGNALNANLGSLRYFAVLVVLAVSTGGCHLLLSEGTQPGSSGVVSGVMGMFVAAYPALEVDTISLWGLRPKRVLIPAWFLALIWFTLDIGAAFLGQGSAVVSIAGLILGISGGLLLKRTGILLHFEKSAAYRRAFKQE
jgi:membrane associated rhomboid family serine protease